MVERIIKILELTFSAAHYLEGHPKCGVIHGHTFFVRNIEILTSGFVDFGDVKAVISDWDHRLIIPKEHAAVWLDKIADLLAPYSVGIKLKFVEGYATVETISEAIATELKSLKGVESVRLELYEGPNQGTVLET